MQRYAEWVSAKLDTGKASGEISSAIDTRAPAIIFIGAIQRLIMQSMNSCDLKLARAACQFSSHTACGKQCQNEQPLPAPYEL